MTSSESSSSSSSLESTSTLFDSLGFGLGRTLDLKSGEGSLEITIRFWTVNFLIYSSSEDVLSVSKLYSSVDTSYVVVMAVIVLN